ncbi:hypothetical protein HPB52_006340 [Rhipicephalus sanguineus]|uniref:Nucleic-acid-binding protein from transposon X-element n=1 Tax=Rhipicephalus sanguineus TaxID=34632 RepID=A0A9D4QA40_RHISA|nr:hypothetical protein HPB52_006340 [Rhipicephalus sanguineus]
MWDRQVAPRSAHAFASAPSIIVPSSGRRQVHADTNFLDKRTRFPLRSEDLRQSMPTRPAKPRGEAERGALAASSRPTRSAAPARTPTDNDPELAKALMDTDDHDIETQVSSAADADDDFLSPDEVLQGESTSAAGCEDKDSAEERDDETKNGQWQVAMSLRQRKRVRKQERAALDDSVARGVTESNSRGARTLAEERRGRASERDRRRTRAAPLPKNDMKIIMRPRPGLIVKELKTYEVARAIEHASGDPEACNSHKFLLRLRNGSIIIIASTPYEDVAEKILKIKTLELNGTNYPVNTYISTPAGYLKGVVHGLERETPEAELLSHLRVRTQGVTIVQARMLGQSQTAVITFDGPILPRFVYYYGGEMPCVPYQPTRQYCKLCKSQGHRTDVCPTPMTKACSNCRLRDPPEDHTCEPECALCGGGHPTAASECTKKLKRVPQRGWPPLSHKHSTPQTTGLLKRRCLRHPSRFIIPHGVFGVADDHPDPLLADGQGYGHFLSLYTLNTTDCAARHQGAVIPDCHCRVCRFVLIFRSIRVAFDAVR